MHLAVKNLISLNVALALVGGFCLATPQKAASATPKPALSKSGSSKSGSSNSGLSSSGSSSSKTHHKKGRRRSSWKKHGQQGIQPDRVREIQQALVREKYLTGEPNGLWDARSQAAMAKYQTDNGWQSKVTPDSRALIKLGLGPDRSQQSLLNGTPQASGVASATTPHATSNAPDKP